MYNAENYVGSMRLQYRDAGEIIDEFAEEFRAMEGSLIDIGCGPGIVLNDLLLPKVGENCIVVGADISQVMLEYAKKNSADKKGMSYIQLDIETSDLPKNLVGQFHHATAFYCLHWCENMKIVAENIYQLLRPGGNAIVLMISDNMIFDFYLKQQKDPRFSPYMQDAKKYLCPYHGSPNPEMRLRGELERAGFRVLHCSNRKKIFSYETVDRLLDMIISVNPFLQRMPEDVKKEYQDDIEKRTRDTLRQMIKNGISNGSTADDNYRALVALFEKPAKEIMS